MGVTKKSTEREVAAEFLLTPTADEITVALAGNPNVGKSTLFNALTGLNQHTGNWPGKTVALAAGRCTAPDGKKLLLLDLPGTYSLLPHSAEEEVAGEYLCFGRARVVIAVCDATCLERNLNLVLQVLEVSRNVVVCLNMQDEAKRKGIMIDLPKLEKLLGVPVVPTSAAKGEGIAELLETVAAVSRQEGQYYKMPYHSSILRSAAAVRACFSSSLRGWINEDWLALRTLADASYPERVAANYLAEPVADPDGLKRRLIAEQRRHPFIEDEVTAVLVRQAERISRSVTRLLSEKEDQRSRRLDRFLTGKYTGFPIMLLLLAGIFWLTIVGANIPSGWLSSLFNWLGGHLETLLFGLGLPSGLISLLMDGVYLVVTWVVAVMLPPMAIFFPLFTLLEDLGYLPRVAFNLDHYFRRCSACGKQALTICMGFGCNAAGIVGCRIIDSPRERLIAMLTNVFVPCNGRFPAMIAIISMFLVGGLAGIGGSLAAALILAVLILLGIVLTLFTSWGLSRTLLKGAPSAFTLELPPYRKPQIGKILLRSIFDRTLFVLRRALWTAVPAGVMIWLFANISVGGETLLSVCADFLDPFARWFGLDGVILLSFLLGLPANEIVLPLMLMAYLSMGNLVEMESLGAMRDVLLANGWTLETAVCVLVFYLVHWPCATTLLTIQKESGSWKWTALSCVIPAVMGLILCFLLKQLLAFGGGFF